MQRNRSKYVFFFRPTANHKLISAKVDQIFPKKIIQTFCNKNQIKVFSMYHHLLQKFVFFSAFFHFLSRKKLLETFFPLMGHTLYGCPRDTTTREKSLYIFYVLLLVVFASFEVTRDLLGNFYDGGTKPTYTLKKVSVRVFGLSLTRPGPKIIHFHGQMILNFRSDKSRVKNSFRKFGSDLCTHGKMLTQKTIFFLGKRRHKN